MNEPVVDPIQRQFRKKPVVIDATQWFRNGDHPLDYANDRDEPLEGEAGIGKYKKDFCRVSDWEGEVVRRYRHPGVSPYAVHATCGKAMGDHGWLDTPEGGHIVCPGDWIITGVKGEHYPCKPDIFAATYEPVEAIP